VKARNMNQVFNSADVRREYFKVDVLAEAVERMDSERRSGASRAAFGRWRLSPELATSAAGPMFF
jgi:hypothetical protein